MSDGPVSMTAKAAGPDPLIGRVIAERFKVVELIARGGMGKVYRAEQAPLGRVCALKILNPNYNGDADPEFHRRFFREASTASKITHPNSVTIFDYGVDDEIYYMAMEYLEGQTLHQALRVQKTLPEERAGRIAQQICRALREAHALGVIHRDLKPANIFLTRHGDDEDFVKVLDFGLVKHIAERPEEQLTQTGLFMGSPKYMAPEQIQGAVVDARTDIYSLGIIMYEMLAGKVPFERPTSVNILMAHVGEPPPPMREVNPNMVCTPVFEDLVMRCIAKDPEERFRSMDELLQALKRAHGVSMTGQLAAVMSSGSYAPPPLRSSSRPGGGVVLATGPYTPAGTPRSVLEPPYTPQPGPLLDDLEMRPRRSRGWIFIGVVLAAVLGGLLGMAAFRMQAQQAGELVKAPTQPPAPTPSAAPSAVASASPPAPERTATVHVTSEPPGATVREDSAELCAATPCDVTFKGDAAEPGKVHKLVLQRPGFRPETRNVKPLDAMLAVKLVKGAGGSFVRPPPPPPAPKPTATATATATTETPTTVPSGFKENPFGP